MTIRKNFTMPESIVYRSKNEKIRKQKKLDSLEKMSGMFSGLIPKYVDMQWIKSQNEN